MRFLIKYKIHGIFKFIAKFGVPCILFINLVLDYYSENTILQYNYDRSVEVTGFGLLILFFLFVDGALRGKCVFFFLSVLGLSINCFVNIYYFGNYKDEYYRTILLVPEFVISAFVLCFIIVETEKTYDNL